MLLPLSNYGLKAMSMSFLIPQSSPVIWRGLMVMKALEQLLFQVYWGKDDIDVLVIDMPPGTGDTQLSLVQNVVVDGVVQVTTPQMVSVNVVRRGIEMWKKVKVPVRCFGGYYCF